MPLDAGVRLDTFEILGPLGSGGMGEVYRARDLRLGREVALKVLPEAFAKDPARAARFQREARLLAAINHPGIAAIYGAEKSGAVEYIVMELVPGETLGERMATGALPLSEALRLGLQTAEALEAAHERGVIHRDLKPSNIKVTPEGKVKVLDLGLAKAMEPSSPDENLSNSPTLVADQTRPGVILGTVEFMSPEQARGKEVDRRSDIWAFGCILFEMLSGKRAFTGESPSDVLVSILSSEPDWNVLPPVTPPRIRELLGRCLEKDSANRLRDIGDARLEIERSLADLKEGSAPDRRLPVQTARGRRTALLAVGILAAVAAAVWLVQRSARPIRAGPESDRALVVLPSRDLTGAPGGQLVGDGLVETLSARLGEIPGIQVVTPTAAVAASDAQSDPFRAAQRVGANLAVRSSFMRSGDSLRITYTVWNVQTRSQVASGTIDGLASDVFGVQDRLAERVAAGLSLPRRPIRATTPSGLEGAANQEKYLQAIGNLQRYDKPASVDAAVGLLTQLSAEAPGSALVNAALGRAYLYKFVDTRDRKWMDLSLASCARAEQSRADLPEVAITRGELLLAAGKPGEAVTAFQKALEVQPSDYPALLGLARAYDAAGSVPQAESAYHRALNLQPRFWAGYSGLAAFYYGHGQYPKAAEMFRRVTELTPDNANAFSNLGAVYTAMGRFEEALDAYRKSLSLAPTDAAHSNVGTVEYYLGHYRESAAAFEKAIAMTPGHFLFWANLGDAERWTKGLEPRSAEAYRRAIALARDELRVNGRNAQAHAYLAACLAKSGHPQEAASEIREALALQPSNPEFLYVAAVVSNLAGRRSEALERLQQAVVGGFSAAMILRDPELADLKNEDAFQKIVRTGS